MNLEVVPLAITMMAGPQIMSAIIFVTIEKAVPASLAFITAVAVAATVGLFITRAIASTLSLGDPSDAGSTGAIIQYILVGLLVLAGLKAYLGRETSSRRNGSAGSRRRTRSSHSRPACS